LGSHVVIRSLAASIGATLATAPVAAFTLGRVATIGVGLNLLTIPLVAAAMPAVLMALVLHGAAPESAAAFAASADLLLVLLTRIAVAGAGLPGASEVGAAGWRAAFPWVATLIAALWITHRRSTPPGLVCGTAALVAAGRCGDCLAAGHEPRRPRVTFAGCGAG
jgi:predicted membrane metal-binding protein